MHLSNYRVVRQIDHSQPEPAQKFKPVVFFLWLGKQLGLGRGGGGVLRGGLLLGISRRVGCKRWE